LDTSHENVVMALRVDDACKALGVSRSTLYRRIAKAGLPAKKSGGIRLIPAASLNAWLSALPAANSPNAKAA